MPINAAHANAAPRTITLDGQEWTLTPMSLRAWAEFDTWARERYLSNVQDTAEQIRDREIAASVVRDAIDLVNNAPEDDAVFRGIKNSSAGTLKLIWLHMRPAHHDLTEDRVAELLNSPEMQATVMDVINRTIDVGGGTKKKKTPRPMHKAKKKRRRRA